MIHIIGYSGNKKAKVLHLDEKWSYDSIYSLFHCLDAYIENNIPPRHRVNLHYTIGDTNDRVGRGLHNMQIIPFDFDHVSEKEHDKIIDAFLTLTGLNKEQITVISSGHGMHIVLFLDNYIEAADIKYYQQYYKAFCLKLSDKLADIGLSRDIIDMNVFRRAGTLRLPGTMNKKPDMPAVPCAILSLSDVKVPNKLVEWVGDIEVKDTDYTGPQEITSYPVPDTEGVLTCPFLQNCYNYPNKVSEPQWYSMLSILSRLEDGDTICHEYSKNYNGYSYEETESKRSRALTEAGPSTCGYIDSIWCGCSDCKHYETAIVSPIMIRSDAYIATKSTGFYFLKTKQVKSKDANGNVVIHKKKEPSTPDYRGLLKFFDQKHRHKVDLKTGILYLQEGNKWVEGSHIFVENFAEKYFNPKPSGMMVTEFKRLIYRTNIFDKEWLNPSGKLNLTNGVLNLETMKLLPHSEEQGFTYELPYAYEPSAECPLFAKFMKEITLNRASLINVLLEFMGYAISNMECHYDKALMLVGGGSNGKSTFMDVMKALVGQDNYSGLMLNDFGSDTSRYSLYNKLFNISEETPRRSLSDNAYFKNLVSGGTTVFRKLYHPAFCADNKAKLIFACNEMPDNYDPTDGMFRRLLIVPFDNKFTDSNKDDMIKYKLEEELSGILNWVITAYHRLKKNNRFTKSREIEYIKEEYRRNSDTVLDWFEENFIHEPAIDDFYPSRKLYQDYYENCAEIFVRPIPFRKFSSRLKAILGTDFYVTRKYGQKATKGFTGLSGIVDCDDVY